MNVDMDLAVKDESAANKIIKNLKNIIKKNVDI